MADLAGRAPASVHLRELVQHIGGYAPPAASDEELVEELAKVASFNQKRAEAAEDRCRTLLDAVRLLDGGIVITDESARVTYRSNVATRWVEADERGAILDALSEVAKNATAGCRNTRTIDIPGPPQRSVCLNGLPVFAGERATAGAVVLMEDADKRSHLESAQRDFVSNVSHELKTPVGALALLAETVLVERDPVVGVRLVQRMQVEAARVCQVIDDLLDLSRIESANDLPSSTIPVRVILDQALNRVRYTAEHHSISLLVDGDLDATVWGGEHEFISAIQHLVENALKYSDDGSNVTISVTADGDWTEIAVRDHGIGIPSPCLDRIFERFYRVDDSRTRTSGGTGLGLSIVRHVVESRGGEVRVASQEGNGSTFTLRLAAERPQVSE